MWKREPGDLGKMHRDADVCDAKQKFGDCLSLAREI